MIKVAVDKKVVQDAKCELVDHLKSKINPDYVKALCREQYGIEMIKAAECKDGDIVIDNDQIAYKLNFEVSFTMPILINNGNNTIKNLSQDEDDLLQLEDEIKDIELEEKDDEADQNLPAIEM